MVNSYAVIMKVAEELSSQLGVKLDSAIHSAATELNLPPSIVNRLLANEVPGLGSVFRRFLHGCASRAVERDRKLHESNPQWSEYQKTYDIVLQAILDTSKSWMDYDKLADGIQPYGQISYPVVVKVLLVMVFAQGKHTNMTSRTYVELLEFLSDNQLLFGVEMLSLARLFRDILVLRFGQE